MKTLIIVSQKGEVHVEATRFSFESDRLTVFQGDSTNEQVAGIWTGVTAAYFEDVLAPKKARGSGH